MTNKNWIVLAALIAAGSTTSTLPAQAKKFISHNATNKNVSLGGQKIRLNGKTYKLSGWANVRSSTVRVGSITRVKMHYNTIDAHLMAPTGKVYGLSGSDNATASVNSNGGSFKASATFRVIGSGKDNKMRLHMIMDGTLDPAGRVTFAQARYTLS